MALIETVKLEQKYDGRAALKGVNLKIERGDVFALIGPTGAGKTTLIKLLDLLNVASSGIIYFDGVDVTRDRRKRLEARRRMALVQQEPIVFAMSVYDNIACGLRWRHKRNKIVRQKVESMLELVGMTDYRDRSAKTLSGGETRRLAIARALVTEPEVLFLDEPTTNLDPISMSKIEEVLVHIIREQKTTVVMATHDMLQGQRLADGIGVLINGKLQQVGSPNEVFYSPKTREVAEFVGMENILGGVVLGKEGNLVTIGLNGSDIQAISEHEVGDRVYAIIKPEDITFSLSREKGSTRNVFEGKITKVTPVGPLVRLEADCRFPLFGLVTNRSAQELGLTIGKQIYASFKATAAHTIKRWD